VASQVPPKDPSRHFRLPVDRVFTMRGFGTVVTGTLISGRVRLDDEVEAHPIGERFRVRGIQVHGAPAPEALAGQRTALNLAGGDASRLARGVTLTAPGLFRPVQAADCLFELLPSAKPLRHRAPVHFHTGTAEVIAEARLLESGQPLAPGSRCFVRFLLREPVLLLPGDRFIVRMFSPVVTIGGGTVVEIGPPARLKRRETAERLKELARRSAEERVALLVASAPYGLPFTELVARTGLTLAQLEAAAHGQSLVLLREPQPWLIAHSHLAALASRLQAALDQFHRANPLQPGMSREALRAREAAGAPSFLLEAAIAAAGNIVAEGELLRLAGHSVRLRQEEAEALARIERAFERAALAAPSTAEVLAQCGVEPARARTLLQILLRDKRLVRVGDELVFHAGAIDQLRRLVAAHRGERFTVAQFKDWTGVSRKYAIPLLEYLDRERVTMRQGDTRVVV
jgi:selenocysteine-specific elongation factor